MLQGFGSGFSYAQIGQTGFANGLASNWIAIPDESMVLNYQMGDTNSYPGSGITVTDLRGNSNATLYNSPSYSPSGYIEFNPADSEYMITNASLASKIRSDVTTIAMWAYPMDDGVLLSERGEASLSSGWHDSQIEVVSGKMKFGMWSSSGLISLVSNIDTPPNAWYHLVMTYNGENLFAYVNGNYAGFVTFDRLNPIEGGTDIFYAIAGPDTTNMGDGTYAKMRLGGFQVYNLALTSLQVGRLYENGKNRYSL